MDKENNNNESYNINNVLEMKPEALAVWLNQNYLEQIPISLETVEELKAAGTLLGKLANTYSFVKSIGMFANLAVRDSKRKKLDKAIIDENISRRDVLDTFADTIKIQYNAVSRMITVKKQVDDEMRMI